MVLHACLHYRQELWNTASDAACSTAGPLLDTARALADWRFGRVWSWGQWRHPVSILGHWYFWYLRHWKLRSIVDKPALFMDPNVRSPRKTPFLLWLASFPCQEGARTYGSTFEKAKTNQMFRVPFVTCPTSVVYGSQWSLDTPHDSTVLLLPQRSWRDLADRRLCDTNCRIGTWNHSKLCL